MSPSRGKHWKRPPDDQKQDRQEEDPTTVEVPWWRAAKENA